jgi:hypothetical protein
MIIGFCTLQTVFTIGRFINDIPELAKPNRNAGPQYLRVLNDQNSHTTLKQRAPNGCKKNTFTG